MGRPPRHPACKNGGRRALAFCCLTERMLGEWLQENPFLYNKGMAEYKDMKKKNRMFQEKGKTISPPLSGDELKRWLESIRNRFGRLTKDKSGQNVPRPCTDRERWILDIFHFLGRHIVRQRKPKTLELPQVRRHNSFIIIFPLLVFMICDYVTSIGNVNDNNFSK